nr:hypothetical protein [uncultured Halomonas sp.]
MSTNNDSPKPGHDNWEEFKRLTSHASAKDKSKKFRSAAEAELEKELAGEKDGRREDRFMFVIALVVIFDVWAMQDVDTWTLPVVVGIVELFALLIFARRMGVEEIHFWLNQLLPRIKIGAKPEEPEQKQAPLPKEQQSTENKNQGQ